jgi:hypothetical protein
MWDVSIGFWVAAAVMRTSCSKARLGRYKTTSHRRIQIHSFKGAIRTFGFSTVVGVISNGPLTGVLTSTALDRARIE